MHAHARCALPCSPHSDPDPGQSCMPQQARLPAAGLTTSMTPWQSMRSGQRSCMGAACLLTTQPCAPCCCMLGLACTHCVKSHLLTWFASALWEEVQLW
eukprot:360301-Chlamydomonas_euryale.AAC.5